MVWAVTALLLDMMDTVVRDPFRVEIPAFFGLSLQQLLAEKHPEAWIDFEHGQLSEQQYAERMFADGRPVDAAGLGRCIEQAYRYVDGMETLLVELAQRGVEMHALSNYPIWYQRIERKLGLSRYVSWRFVSCHTGVRKPAPEAFLGAARALGREPGECLFVDDREKNCAAARAVGMPAIVFSDTEQLRQELMQRGVL
jgi:HAD superfamily hydrolase (TIGR01509 family)